MFFLLNQIYHFFWRINSFQWKWFLGENWSIFWFLLDYWIFLHGQHLNSNVVRNSIKFECCDKCSMSHIAMETYENTRIQYFFSLHFWKNNKLVIADILNWISYKSPGLIKTGFCNKMLCLDPVERVIFPLEVIFGTSLFKWTLTVSWVRSSWVCRRHNSAQQISTSRIC